MTGKIKRPASATAAGGSAVALTAIAFGAPDAVVAALVAISGLAPVGVSLLVDHGGIRGVARTLWAGRS